MIPLSSLLTAGVAHIPIPASLLLSFSAPGWLARTIAGVADGTVISSEDHHGLKDVCVTLTRSQPKFNCFKGFIRRIEWEENGWHYDIGIASDVTYLQHDAITAADRQVPANLLDCVCTIAFPIESQGQTVCERWDTGEEVQAPAGCATVFFPRLTWHRGARNPGLRGLFVGSLAIPLL